MAGNPAPGAHRQARAPKGQGQSVDGDPAKAISLHIQVFSEMHGLQRTGHDVRLRRAQRLAEVGH